VVPEDRLVVSLQVKTNGRQERCRRLPLNLSERGARLATPLHLRLRIIICARARLFQKGPLQNLGLARIRRDLCEHKRNASQPLPFFPFLSPSRPDPQSEREGDLEPFLVYLLFGDREEGHGGDL
jgi:hypothetical protein